MRFMLLRRSDAQTESGHPLPAEMVEAMSDYRREMEEAGVFVGGDGLHSSQSGARVVVRHGDVTVVDGPFSETKEMIAGFVVIDVPDLQTAVKWAARCPSLCNCPHAEIEVRQVIGLDSFPPEMHHSLSGLPWSSVTTALHSQTSPGR